MTKQEMTAKAERMGTQAFENGKDRAPVLNADIMEMVSNLENKGRMVAYKSFLKGWDSANVAALIA